MTDTSSKPDFCYCPFCGADIDLCAVYTAKTEYGVLKWVIHVLDRKVSYHRVSPRRQDSFEDFAGDVAIDESVVDDGSSAGSCPSAGSAPPKRGADVLTTTLPHAKV